MRKHMGVTWVCAGVIALFLAWAGLAAAQPVTTLGAGGTRPWSRGLSPKGEAEARRLFERGNTLVNVSALKQAAEAYVEALKHWDHPAIHYNLALVLINMNEQIEAREHLEAAARYGAEPLDPQKYQHAIRYKTLLEGQLAWVRVTCDVPGAMVAMDGKDLFRAPGSHERWVLAGPHSFTATRVDLEPDNTRRSLSPGSRGPIALEPKPLEYRRLWPAWRPWAVVGAGAVVAAGGGLLHLQARDSFRAFDKQIAACGGCRPAPELTQVRREGDTLQTLAIGAYAAGGATLAAGAALLYVNRLQPYRPKQEQDPDPGQKAVSVAPLIGGDLRGAMVTFHF